MEKSLQLMEQGEDLELSRNESTQSARLNKKELNRRLQGKVKIRLDRKATKAGRIFGVDDPFEKPERMYQEGKEGGPRSKSKFRGGSVVGSRS